MKIVFISTGLIEQDNYPHPNLGGQTQIWGLSKEFVKNGHDVIIIIADKTANITIVDGVKLIAINTGIKDEFFFGIVSQFIFSYKIIKHIIKLNPHVIISRFRYSGFFSSQLDIPCLFILASPDALEYTKKVNVKGGFFKKIFFYFNRFIESKVMANSDQIIVLNIFLKDYLSNFYSSNKVTFLPNAINPKEYSNKGDNNFILFAGRFDWNKRPEVVIKAYSQLNPKLRHKFRLLIVGRAWDNFYEKKINSLINSLKLTESVEIIPWLKKPELQQLMERCSVLVVPSLYEVFPNVILEAMASEKVVIASNIPGTQDIIINKVNGFLFSKEDIFELKKILHIVLSDTLLREKIGKNARYSIINKYSIDKIALEYLENIKKIPKKTM
ncbi:glycosyltransferase family 4 protein [Methanospirillum lacunae]|uniref:Glycosyl transferase family 1 domain-containing protein n=1 Tax=Methanospirillum lacunae TaxID=668570 RepID=A0A2V2N2B0_9EURY|nr:glycosyltransferase family 4 protein [Methanospirillum lacunae]PWR72760.1 hypothetical protein DK846_07360 [Methanospirillum lacunae]